MPCQASRPGDFVLALCSSARRRAASRLAGPDRDDSTRARLETLATFAHLRFGTMCV